MTRRATPGEMKFVALSPRQLSTETFEAAFDFPSNSRRLTPLSRPCSRRSRCYSEEEHPNPAAVLMPQLRYTTPHGITVTRTGSKIPFRRGLGQLLTQLDTKRGVYLSSGYEYPERYSRWDVASIAPPLEIVGRGRTLEFHALNGRGEVLLKLFARLLEDHPDLQSSFVTPYSLTVRAEAARGAIPGRRAE